MPNEEVNSLLKKRKKEIKKGSKIAMAKERNLAGHPGRHEMGGSGERKLEATTVQ
jgi:hypothetical protein